MSLLFADGFDHYATILDKWTYSGNGGSPPGGDCTIRLNTGQSRTGIGCLQINSGAFGPTKQFGHIVNLLVATNWYSDQSGSVILFRNTDADTGFNSTALSLACLADGSVRVGTTRAFIGTSAPGVVTFSTYNSIAMRSTCAVAGSVDVWVNGIHVLALTNVDTTHANNAALLYFNGFELMGPPANGATCFHDDVYALDCATSPNQTFLGALKIYALPPTANAAVAWTPLAGTNWSEVNEVPPDGDTSYVSSGNPGDTDQYVYPLTGPPAASSIFFVEHDLDMEVDSGSRSVGSVANGAAAAGVVALGNGYHIFPTPYDINPGTGFAWTLADWPSNFGPQVTA
jgi:hypothetical protein